MTDLIALNDDSKVWIYHASRVIDENEIPDIKGYIHQFVHNWVSHNRSLKAYGNIFHNRMIALFVDETQAGASGCSIDSSVRFLKDLGNHYGTDFFDRMLFSYIKNDEVHTVNRAALKEAYEAGKIDDKTLFFDTLVKDKKQFIDQWLVPLGESWHKRML